MTNLPASEEAYSTGVPQQTQLIKKALTHEEIANLSPMAGVVYVTHFFGLNLTHLHRPEPDDDEENLQGNFWKRHRSMDNVLSNLSLALPEHLRLPSGMRDPNVVFINFSGMFSCHPTVSIVLLSIVLSSYFNHLSASSSHLQGSEEQSLATNCRQQSITLFVFSGRGGQYHAYDESSRYLLGNFLLIIYLDKR